MGDTDAVTETLFSWFQSQNGMVDASSMGFTEFPDSGRGAVALRDIPVRSRSIWMSTRLMLFLTCCVGRPYVVCDTSAAHVVHADVCAAWALG